MKLDVYSLSKLAFHEDKVRALSSKEVTSPIVVRVKPTNRCNHGCFYCSYQPDFECKVSEEINLKDKIPREKIMEILNDFKDMGVKAITYSGGGEPLIYPYIEEALEKTLENKIESSIITNGQNLNGKKAELLSQAEWVRISTDTNDSRTFRKIRNRPRGWFFEIMENIRNFAKIKKPDCVLGIYFTVHKRNFDQIYNSAKFYKDLGVNNIKFTPMYEPNNLEAYHAGFKNKAIEQLQKAKELENENFKIHDVYESDFELAKTPKRNYSQCPIIQTVPVIGADCAVYFCHDKTYTRDGILGHIKDQSFKDLWFSEESKKIFRNFNPKQECQHHCSYDFRNIEALKMINDLDNIDKYKPKTNIHQNFI